MMIFKKAIPRRTFLRGLGASLALPLLDGMVPAFAGTLDAAAQPVRRMSIVYVPNGIIMDKWTPAAEGDGFELTPILEPLAAFRNRMTVLTGLHDKSANLGPGESGGGDHARCGGSFLTGVHPKRTEGADIHSGISVDQFAAKELGKHTQLASLELSLDSTEFVGSCETGYSCAYMNTLSWRSATTPVPNENNPRAVFERLFGDSDTTNPAERRRQIQKDRSILDGVMQSVSRLQNGLNEGDRGKLTEWLDAIRDVERRIQIAEEQASKEVPTLDRPAGIPATFEEHAKIMFDLQVLAYQCDLTRVITFMLGRETSPRVYKELDISDQHHPLTHHQGDAAKIEKVLRINTYHTKTFSYFLEKLQSTADGDGSLLDHLTLVYGGGISDGNQHLHVNLPLVLFSGGQRKAPRHIRYPADTPVSNLWIAMLDRVGVQVDDLGDSTGKLQIT